MSVLTYNFKAINKAGRTVRSTVDAASESEAFRRLSTEGLTPVWIRHAKDRATRGRVRAREIAAFTGQFGVLIGARVSIGDALLSISEQESNPRLKAIIQQTAGRIEAGESIAAALTPHRAVFGEMYIETIRAAEKSGSLGKVLEHLSELMERSEETRRQVKGAMMYPSCVIVVLVIAVAFLIGFVIPKFARMFKARNVDLPDLTRVLMFIGESLQSYWWAYLGAIGLVIVVVRAMLKSESGREVIDRMLHRVPVIGTLLRGAAMSRFCHVMGMSISAGLGLIESIELAGRSAARPMLKGDVDLLTSSVRAGAKLTDSLRKCTYITPFTRRMLSSGEASGEVGRMCAVVARHYDRESAHTAKNISTLIEPVLVVVIAMVVLVVALAIFLPMWNMVNLVG
jgi:MSHA biogenesis protein MshG